MHWIPVYPSLQVPGHIPLVLEQTAGPLQKPHLFLQPAPNHPSVQAVKNLDLIINRTKADTAVRICLR